MIEKIVKCDNCKKEIGRCEGGLPTDKPNYNEGAVEFGTVALMGPERQVAYCGTKSFCGIKCAGIWISGLDTNLTNQV